MRTLPLFASLILTAGSLNLAFSQEPVPNGMVLIPGGNYYMGSNDHQRIAQAKHPVTLKSFYMDMREVSNEDYHKFCMSTGHKLPEFWGMDRYKSGLDYPEHPVV